MGIPVIRVDGNLMVWLRFFRRDRGGALIDFELSVFSRLGDRNGVEDFTRFAERDRRVRDTFSGRFSCAVLSMCLLYSSLEVNIVKKWFHA